MRITVQRALLGALTVALVAGLLPAAIALDRRLAHVLEQRSRDDLLLAPRVLADRTEANASALMMYAKELAHLPGLAEAMSAGDRERAERLLARASINPPNARPVLVDDADRSWIGPRVDPGLAAETRSGHMPVAIRATGEALYNVALAPVEARGRWLGAAGLAVPVDEQLAAVLGGLTRAGVIIVGRSVVASTVDSATTRAVASAARSWTDEAEVHEVLAAGRRLLVVLAPLGDAGTVVFVRDLAHELGVVPQLRRLALLSLLGGLFVALTLGALLATRVSRPVRELALAAEQLGTGDFDAPLPRSRLAEVSRMAATFETMRRALAARMDQLRHANRELSDRHARLTALQSELVRRERLDATGRLVAQLAHEIRNPVANVRNCLELIRRRVESDAETREFAELATEELLRMHFMAEQLLNLNRPPDPGALSADVRRVARDVVALTSIGVPADQLDVTLDTPEALSAAINPDALKQVLLNLTQNAREAMAAAPDARGRIDVRAYRHGDEVVIEVLDSGPGIPGSIRDHLFDPFFTTKGRMHGVGLGLFVADGLVRTAGGRISAENRKDGPGAMFSVRLPVASVEGDRDVSPSLATSEAPA